jgi:hypothetical protein
MRDVRMLIAALIVPTLVALTVSAALWVLVRR